MIAIHFTEGLRRVRKRFRLRSLEWEHACVTTLWGAILIANPALFDGPSFSAFAAIAGAQTWGLVVFSLGVLRVAALAINGFLPRPTALARSFSASIGIMLFAALSFGFLFAGTFGTALALYPVIAFFGLFSLYWSVLDVALPDYHDAGN